MSEKQKRISEKIRKLRHEGEPEEKSIAMAMSMERSGRLRRHGKYVHKGKKRRSGRR